MKLPSILNPTAQNKNLQETKINHVESYI
uniref:Yeast URA3 gene 5'-region for oritidine-5'-phosphate decarboxylase (OMPdecarboxylase) n=1 Tax=Saccharomyces cerevisiae TaxID=4932 RepID=E9PA10_YEASX|nr:unnamed protein product [Saccharomyces cerevisiae]